MIDKKLRNQKRRMLVFNTAAKLGSGYEGSYGSEKEDDNRNHSVLNRQGNFKCSNKA